MLQSKLFPKTKKQAPKDAVSVNHKLLVQAGFIDQLMAGSWTILPLGWRVVSKITQIIREEMNATGAQEMLMPLMHPKDIWNETGRWDEAKSVMYQLKDSRDKDFALSFTHEEIVMDLLRKHINSYADLPVAIYHFSTKFRNEPRPTGGILRGREFMMKDLYSAHTTEEDMLDYYEKVSFAYLKIFERMGFDIYVTEAAGGVFTEGHTREFQVLADAGEDTIYIEKDSKKAINKEVFDGNTHDFEERRSIEVGNIFPFGDKKYSEKMNVKYTDEKGEKRLVHFASYGIGVTRVMGAAVEVFHDEGGIIWPRAIAPYDVHLVELGVDRGGEVHGRSEDLYNKLKQEGVDVLWDERDVSAGEKFADFDLIGIPFRVVVSEKTADKFELKCRDGKDVELLEFDGLVKRLES